MPRLRKSSLVAGGIKLVRSPADMHDGLCVLCVQAPRELDAWMALPAPRSRARHWGLVAPFLIRSTLWPPIHARFHRVAYFDSSDRLDPPAKRAIEIADPAVVIGTLFDPPSCTLTLIRGDLTTWHLGDELLVHWFKSAAQRPQLQDGGTTLTANSTTVAVLEIFRRLDPILRRKLARQHWGKRQDIGARIRHLRKTRGLRREDFPGLTSKTVARIERGEITAPQRETIRLIARHLHVDPATLIDPG